MAEKNVAIFSLLCTEERGVTTWDPDPRGMLCVQPLFIVFMSKGLLSVI